ncbi:adenylate kinase 8 [Tiliqua scincoides]|uniref:adenylate kinase 8 n=1 Tax=Tiliqua scincoides TaxID=71010 RepID=UPI003461A5E5
MDATKRPVYVPPEMGHYAENYRLFHLMRGMLEGLLIHMPEEPVDFLIKYLKNDNEDVPRICILGPPASGKTTIAMWLCKQLVTPRISQETLLTKERSFIADKVEDYQGRQQDIPDEAWAELIYERLQFEDCVKQGWVLEGIPQTRELARTLQAMAVIPRHVVVLYAPDTVLIERNLGKRVDTITGEVYHTTFDWPSEEDVRRNLIVPDDISEMETSRRLMQYHRNFPGILQSFEKPMKLINADQPCADVFSQVLTHVLAPPRTLSPFSPRILLCGPPGSGKSLQAALIAQKYGLINVSCGQMLKEAVAAETKLGELIKPFLDSGWPVSDSIVLKVLSDRLNMLDCHIRGWVLHGFPRDEDQARQMENAHIYPNRVIFLHLPIESIVERLCSRKMDPITGERYHNIFKPAICQEVHDRLLTHPREREEKVRNDVDAYFRLSSGLETFFKDSLSINADQDPQTVLEYIESYVVNPLPVTEAWKEEVLNLQDLWPST